MLKNKFKIFDNQNFTYLKDGQWFSDTEAIEYLANYHAGDYSGEMTVKDESGNEQRDEQGQLQYRDCTIYEKLAEITEVSSKLVYLCEHGDWDTHEVVFWNEKGVCVGGDYITAMEETLQEHTEYTAETRTYYELN